jgi:hypothetical protein
MKEALLHINDALDWLRRAADDYLGFGGCLGQPYA